MSKVDDELTRRLHRAERPVDDDALFEGLERRRSHRERMRKVQAGMLTFAVLAATAGGFVALRQVFDIGQRNTGAPSSANGEIVFVREGTDGRSHLYAAQPGGSGLRQITDGVTNHTDPVVSPDGRTIAYVHELESGLRVIASVSIEGGVITWMTEDDLFASDPTWSADGRTIAFTGHAEQSVPPGFDAPQTYIAIYTIDRGEGSPRRITDGGIPFTSDPSWSLDGSSIVFAGGSCTPGCEGAIQSDLNIVDVSTTDSWGLTPYSPDIDEEAPAWSPDGSRIAFIRPGNEGDEVWTISPDGTDETLIATAIEASLERDLAWAPDGSALLVSDGDWIYRVDATPDGDPGGNFVQLVEGHSPAWQPLPAGAEPSATASPEPSVSQVPSPSPAEGQDIGLAFNVCNLERLGGIDFLGDGTQGRAWTGARVRENGECPDPSLGKTYLVAADIDGDGFADTASETVKYCFYCRPSDAVDFDADGDEELVVLRSGGSTPSFMIYGLHGADSDPQITPLLVAEPGNPAARHEPDRPLTFSTGGDEGYSGWVRCEGFPASPVLVITWRDHPIEGDTMEVHETRFTLEDDGMFHVVGSNDYSAPVGEPIPGVSDEPACGVNWQILG
jgi:Tol biopolymer transport system component